MGVNDKETLNQIFDITSGLYKEMSKVDSDRAGDHKAIFTLLTELGRTLVDADRASFWKWDKRNHTLWTTAAVGEGKIVIPEGTGLVGKALSERKSIVTNDPYNCPEFNSDVDKKTGYVTKSILVMPISNCNGEFIGAYQAINKIGNDGKFDLEEDIKRLSLAAFICGITLESQMFLEDSQHDKLTTIKNRMGFFADMDSEFKVALKAGSTVSMFICDIDFFKKVNDTYGHNAGDAVLKHVADIFKNNHPEDSEIYRWGGEEFIMVIKNRDMSEAAKVAEDIRAKVQASTCTFEGTDIKVTMSFGVSQFDGVSTTEEIIQIADEKLYRAKEGGRNQVVS